MRNIRTHLSNILLADEGMILVNKNTGFGYSVLYLGNVDDVSNYDEIPLDEYVEPVKDDEPKDI